MRLHHYNYPWGALTANSAVIGGVWRVIITLGNARSKDYFSKLLTLFNETATVEYAKTFQVNQQIHCK